MFLVSPFAARAQSGGSDTASPQNRPQARRTQPAVGGGYAPGAEVPIAMRGYSPVALVTNRQWVKGTRVHRAIFDGQAYLFPNPRQLQMFRAAPSRYAPVLGGDCVVHFAETGQRRSGDLRHGVVHDDRLYFFSSSENKQKFVDNPGQIVDADLALGGSCPVCLVEMQKEIPGEKELAAVLSGRRYLFPGAQQREMFLAQPTKYAMAAHQVAASLGLASGSATISTGSGSSTSAGSGTTHAGSDTAAAAGSDTAGQGTGSQTQGSAAGPPRGTVALSGYCAVCIHDMNRWVRGNRQHAAEIDGKVYLFPSEKELATFQQNPYKYLPALGGDCVVTFKDQGKRVDGSIFHAVFHKDRLYLFAGEPQKEKFKRDTQMYADADLAFNGKCAVCMVDKGIVVDGSEQFMTVHNGMRYLFPAQEQLDAFNKNPDEYVRNAEVAARTLDLGEEATGATGGASDAAGANESNESNGNTLPGNPFAS